MATTGTGTHLLFFAHATLYCCTQPVFVFIRNELTNYSRNDKYRVCFLALINQTDIASFFSGQLMCTNWVSTLIPLVWKNVYRINFHRVKVRWSAHFSSLRWIWNLWVSNVLAMWSLWIWVGLQAGFWFFNFKCYFCVFLENLSYAGFYISASNSYRWNLAMR